MMDRRELAAQRETVRRLSDDFRAANRKMSAKRRALEGWIREFGTAEALAGAFIAGGLVGLRSAPRPPARVTRDADGESVEVKQQRDSALLRWLKAGLLIWRLHAVTVSGSGAMSEPGG